MPSKNEIWGARIAYLARHAAGFGTITGPVTTDMVNVRQQKRDMVDREIAGHLAAFKSSGAELVIGSGHFMAPKVLDVQLIAMAGSCTTRLPGRVEEQRSPLHRFTCRACGRAARRRGGAWRARERLGRRDEG